MGFASSSQKTAGIHIRLYSRAYVFEDTQGYRNVFVSVDAGMMGQLVKKKVIESLEQELGGDIYTADNVVLSATHTHAGPAGYLQYVLFEVTSLGFIQQTFDAMAQGITRVSLPPLKLILFVSIKNFFSSQSYWLTKTFNLPKSTTMKENFMTQTSTEVLPLIWKTQKRNEQGMNMTPIIPYTNSTFSMRRLTNPWV